MTKYLLGFVFLAVGYQAFACEMQNVTGTDYGGAAYNCEAIMQGQVQDCHPSGSLWICQCAVNCVNSGTAPGSRYTTTTGPDYGSASSNCEVILQGTTSNCHPDGNMWVCGCYY